LVERIRWLRDTPLAQDQGDIQQGRFQLAGSSGGLQSNSVHRWHPAVLARRGKRTTQSRDPTYVYWKRKRRRGLARPECFPTAPGLFALQSQSIDLMPSSVDPDAPPLGYRAIINMISATKVAIMTSKWKWSLAQVELCQQSGSITSQFIFLPTGCQRFVAHDINHHPIAHSTTISAPHLPCHG